MLQYLKPYELNYSGAVCHNLVTSTLAAQNVVAAHVLHAHTHIYQRLKTGCYLQIDPLNLRATKNMQHRFIVMRILNTPVTFIRSRMWIFLDDSYEWPEISDKQ